MQKKSVSELLPKLSELKDKSNEGVMKTEYEERFNTGIDCLDDYFLYNLFSYFSIKEKLAVERVCKRWQRIILQLSEKQTGVGTTWSSDNDSYCLEANREHSVILGDVRDAFPMTNGWLYDMTIDESLKNLSYLAQKCPNLKCFHLSHSIISPKTFEHLVELFPDFECLHLKGNILKLSTLESHVCIKMIDNEWDTIGAILGPYIRHLSVDPHYENRMTETQMKNLIQHFKCLEEFRVGTHFERDVVGKFLEYLPKKCHLFYSLGREFGFDSLKVFSEKNDKNITHLSYFSTASKSHESAKLIGQRFTNLVKLKINLSFNESILTAPSPLIHLERLKEFSIDLNTFADTHVDDGIIWLIKDGLPSVETLEISRACLSSRAFNSISYCLPHLKKLVLKSVEIQCNCTSSDLRDRSERYKCSVCKQKCWKSVSELRHLKSLHIIGYYFRTEKPKPFHEELCELLPQFLNLRHLSIFRFDISSTKIFESLNKLMDKKQDPKDIFILKLKSVPITPKVKTPKVFIFRENFML